MDTSNMFLTLQTLPRELIFMILDYCDARSLVNLLSTAKSINKQTQLILDDKVRYILDNPLSNGLLIRTFAPSDSLARLNGFKTSYVSPIKPQYETPNDSSQLIEKHSSNQEIRKSTHNHLNKEPSNRYFGQHISQESLFDPSSKSQFVLKECYYCYRKTYPRSTSYANRGQLDLLNRSSNIDRGVNSSIVVLEICPEVDLFGQFNLVFELEIGCYNNIPITIIGKNIKLYTGKPMSEYNFPSMGISFKLQMYIDEKLGKHINSCGEKVCNYNVQIFDISINSAYLLNRIEPYLKNTGSFMTDMDYHNIDIDITHYRHARAA